MKRKRTPPEDAPPPLPPPKSKKPPRIAKVAKRVDFVGPYLDAALAGAASEAAHAAVALPTYEALRMRAMLTYVLNMNGCTVPDICALPEFAAVPRATIESWAVRDKWTVEREKHRTRIVSHLETALADELLQDRYRMLKRVRGLAEKAFAHFDDHPFTTWAPDAADTLEPTSLEATEGEVELTARITRNPRCAVCGRKRLGHDDPFFGDTGSQIARALVQLVGVDSTLRATLLPQSLKAAMDTAGGAQQGVGGDEKINLKGAISPEEAQVAAHAILERRRAQLEARPGIELDGTATDGPSAVDDSDDAESDDVGGDA